MAGYGVFEHFKAHGADVPYKRCPECGGNLHMFKHAKRLGEIVFYCSTCDWNRTVVDLAESLGDMQATNTEKVYLDGDNMVTVQANGFTLVANAARAE